MVDRTANRYEISPSGEGIKMYYLETGTTVTGATDTLTATLQQMGMTEIKAVSGFRHSTDGSIIVPEDMTTAVADGTLTVTTITGNNNERRVAIVFGR